MLTILQTFGPMESINALRWVLDEYPPQTATRGVNEINNMQGVDNDHQATPKIRDLDLIAGAYNCLTSSGFSPHDDCALLLNIENPGRMKYFGIIRYQNIIESLAHVLPTRRIAESKLVTTVGFKWQNWALDYLAQLEPPDA